MRNPRVLFDRKAVEELAHKYLILGHQKAPLIQWDSGRAEMGVVQLGRPQLRTLSEISLDGQVRLVDERLEDSSMIATKPFLRGSTWTCRRTP